MQIYDKRLDEIKPYENNPRHNDNAVDAVANSIREFGFKVPIVVDSEGVIVAGHTRYKAAQKLGLQTVPCLVADDLNEEQINAFRLADNKVGELATWDLDTLRVELDNIGEIDMSEFGFNLDGIGEEPQEVQEDDFDEEPPEEPTSALGDIYQLGEHKLMCGDSTNKDDVAKLMDGAKADMVFTDPPYGYSYQSNFRVKTKKFDVLKNDDKILNFFGVISEYIKGFVFVCTSWKVIPKWWELFEQHFPLTNLIIWNKGGGGLGDLKHTFITDYEIILCSNNNQEIKGERIGSVWSVGKDDVNSYVHATQKPIGLSAIAIKECTDKNDIVLDVFGGSGSTLIACEQLNRKCYMMEMSPKYVDVIIKRWEEYTGKKAVKIA